MPARGELPLKRPREWSCLDVARWLKAGGFQDQTHVFLGNRIDGMALLSMKGQDLQEVEDDAARRKLSSKIDALRRRVKKDEEEAIIQAALAQCSPAVSPRPEGEFSEQASGALAPHHHDDEHEERHTSGAGARSRRATPQKKCSGTGKLEAGRGRGGGAKVTRPSREEESGRAASASGNGSRKTTSLRAGGRRSNSEMSSYSGASSAWETRETRTTLPSLVGARSTGGGSSVTGSAHFTSPNEIAERLDTLFHVAEEFGGLATSCSLSKSSNQASPVKKKWVSEHRTSQGRLFGEAGMEERSSGNTIGLYEWHHLMLREGVVPGHVERKKALKIYAQAVKLEPCGGEMNRRGFQQGLR